MLQIARKNNQNIIYATHRRIHLCPLKFVFLFVLYLFQYFYPVQAQNFYELPTIEHRISTSTVAEAFPENSNIRDSVIFELNNKSYYAAIYSSYTHFEDPEIHEHESIGYNFAWSMGYNFALLETEKLRIIDQIPVQFSFRSPFYGKISVYDFTGEGNPDFAYTSRGASSCDTLNIIRIDKDNKLRPVLFVSKKGNETFTDDADYFKENIWIEPGRIEAEVLTPPAYRTIYTWNKNEEYFELIFAGDTRERVEWLEEVAVNRKNNPILINELNFSISSNSFTIFQTSIPIVNQNIVAKNSISSEKHNLKIYIQVEQDSNKKIIAENDGKREIIYYSSWEADAWTDNIYSFCLAPKDDYVFFSWDSWNSLDTIVKLDNTELENAFIVAISIDGKKMGKIFKLPRGINQVKDMYFSGNILRINGSNFNGEIEFSELP